MKPNRLCRKFVHFREPVVPIPANQFNSALVIAVSFLLLPHRIGVTRIIRYSIGAKLNFSACWYCFNRSASG